MEIKDSGARREFETGAVRDIKDGKGRCDLLPLEQVAILIDSDGGDDVLNDHYQYQQTGDVDCIIQAIYDFCYVRGWTMPQAILEVSIHFEDGARKYGERNWEKGLPINCYLDSAIRHYLKWADARTDEPHDRAVIWNLLCMWWTVENKSTDKRTETHACDSISRQAAIDAARKCSAKEVTPNYILIDKAEIMTELMMLPPAQPEQRWIPCSEMSRPFKEGETN